MLSYTADEVWISHLAEKQNSKALDCAQPCCREKATNAHQSCTSNHVFGQAKSQRGGFETQDPANCLKQRSPPWAQWFGARRF